MTSNLKDSGEHLVAHEILERELVGLHKSVNQSFSWLNGTISEINLAIQELSADSKVTAEKIKHLATDKDISQAISVCQTNHKPKPINWKGITALITGIIAAATAAAIAIIQAL